MVHRVNQTNNVLSQMVYIVIYHRQRINIVNVLLTLDNLNAIVNLDFIMMVIHAYKIKF